jgi:uncharacterized protein YjiS (DUF1127 family)
MRYQDARRSGGRGSFWLRLRLALARRRDAGPPLADLSRLDDHLLKDIGLFGCERRMTLREIRRQSP